MSDVSADVQSHANAAVAALLPHAQVHEGSTLAEALHAMLWPFVVSAATQLGGASLDETIPGASDRRAKPWQYVVRFWNMLDSGPELEAETDPAIMTSTGAIPQIVEDLALQMHEGLIPPALSAAAVKPLLPQFRNNLGRGTSAALRIPYEADELARMCQVDVYRLDA